MSLPVSTTNSGTKQAWLTVLHNDKKRANRETFKCQKCLKIGHFTYECKGKRPYMYRDSRSKDLKRMLQGKRSRNLKNVATKKKVVKKRKKNDSSSSDSSSSSSDSSSSDSDSDS